MQGEIIHVGGVDGRIRGDDGLQYTFGLYAWGYSSASPAIGMRVDFEVRGSRAVDIRPSTERSPRRTPYKRIAFAIVTLAAVVAMVAASVFYFESASEDQSAIYTAAFAERIERGSSEKFALVYASQIDAGFSSRYASDYAKAIDNGNSETYARAYAERLTRSYMSISEVAIYANLMDDGYSHWYSLAYAIKRHNHGFGESAQVAHARAEKVDGIQSLAGDYAEQSLNAAVVIAMFSTIDDAEADRRALSALKVTNHVGGGELDDDTVLGLLNDFAPEASIEARAEAANRLASIADESGGQLTPQQGIQVANELSRLVYGHGIDAERRTEAAHEMVRLSQAGELNADNAAELMDTIAPEWSVSERREALGFLAWQFAQGEWDAESTQRTAEEGYTLITGGEIQIERRMEAGVELVGEGLKRYGGGGYDEESVDQTTQMLKATISGDLSPDTVSSILGLGAGEYSASSNAYDSEYYRESEVYRREYAWGRGAYLCHPAFDSICYHYSHGYGRRRALLSTEEIYAGRTEKYAREYARLIVNHGKSERYARIRLRLPHVLYDHFSRGYDYQSYNYDAFADQIVAGRSLDFARIYALQIYSGKRDEDAEVYTHAYIQESRTVKSKGYLEAYAEQIVAGSTEEYARAFAGQMYSGRSSHYAEGYAIARAKEGMDDLSAHAYAHAHAHILGSDIYAESITTIRPESYARTYAEQVAAGRSPTYARAYAMQIAAGRAPVYARAYAMQIAADRDPLFATVYAWVSDLRN